MARPLVVGNGNLLVTFDANLAIRDLYWPFVGLSNHLSGHFARTGLWVDGRFSWLSDPSWKCDLKYQSGTLVTDAMAVNASAQLEVVLEACVLHRYDVLVRRFRIRNLAARPREVRLFCSHDFYLDETDIGDTAMYHPFEDAILHFKRATYLLISGSGPEGGLSAYACGIKGFGGAEGAWRDAEDGELSMNAVAQGSVDSVLGLRAAIESHKTADITVWICAGHTLPAVEKLNSHVRSHGASELIEETAHFWRSWAAHTKPAAELLPSSLQELFERSILTIRTNIDNRGAILAANDSVIMETARAHYSYMWPRDGALTASVLDRLGYQDLTRRFFEFCKNALPSNRGALMHKYSPNGSWGSTWHPWIYEGHAEIAFQEDGTALTLWALWRHYQKWQDLEFIESVYDEFVLPCADFLCVFRDAHTGLPLASYDLWEERRGVHAYTCGTVYGALVAAASIAQLFGDEQAARYTAAANEVQAGIEAHLWSEEHQRFARRLVPKEADGRGDYSRDMTIDSALHALYAFGAFAPDDPKIVSTMNTVRSRLWVQTSVGGIARYEDDYYFRQSSDITRIPGNPWFICTLWYAQWLIAKAKRLDDLAEALDLMHWTAANALPTGILPEQVHPESGFPLSVAPLTWSHAEFAATVLDYHEAQRHLS